MAFPTTSVLFTGSIPNERPLSDSGNFTSGIQIGDGTLQVSLNAIIWDAGNGQAYWNTPFSGDLECFFDLPLALMNGTGVYTNIWLGIQNPNSANLNGYAINITDDATSVWNLYACVNNAFTLLSNPKQAILSGDSIGLSRVGSLLTMYIKHSGAWSAVGAINDSRVTGTGYIGLGTIATSSTIAITNFGGGSIPATTTQMAPSLLAAGVGA